MSLSPSYECVSKQCLAAGRAFDLIWSHPSATRGMGSSQTPALLTNPALSLTSCVHEWMSGRCWTAPVEQIFGLIRSLRHYCLLTQPWIQRVSKWAALGCRAGVWPVPLSHGWFSAAMVEGVDKAKCQIGSTGSARYPIPGLVIFLFFLGYLVSVFQYLVHH